MPLFLRKLMEISKNLLAGQPATLSRARIMCLFHLSLLGYCFGMVSLAQAQTPAAAPPYTLENTQVLTLPSKLAQREYSVFVSLPDSYASSQRSYPVVFVSDANYAFPVARAISRRIADNGARLEDFILVGLSYAKGDTPTQSRNRDYTPSNPAANAQGQYTQGPYGQVEAYRHYLAQQVLPFIAKQYRADMQRTIFIGHSYGGLLGAHVLLQQPELFQHYVLSSPSLWFDKQLLLRQERELNAKRKDLNAKVWLYVGEFESGKQRGDPNMVQDTQTFAAQLRARRFPNLGVQTQVLVGEDHLSAAAVAITRSLRATLGKGPGARR